LFGQELLYKRTPVSFGEVCVVLILKFQTAGTISGSKEIKEYLIGMNKSFWKQGPKA